MHARFFPALLLCTLSLFPAAITSAAPTIQFVVPTFDYPSDNYRSTIARGISNNRTVVGTVDDATTGNRLSFERFSDGSFSAPFAFPGFQGTNAMAVNNSNLICGSVTTNGAFPHGFFYDGQTFTQYDLPGALFTTLTGLNDADDFCGYASVGADVVPFVSIKGTLVTFTLPGVTAVYPQGVNNLGQVAGYYLDPNVRATYHGFIRDTDGTLTFPPDNSHALTTEILGLNDAGLLAGYEQLKGGVVRGFVLRKPRSYVLLDDPDSEFGPTITGINNSGLLSGYYFLESDLDIHSFIAQLVR